jgi:hypothetical protein
MRLEFARFAIDTIAPWVRAEGVYEPANARMPGHWTLEKEGLVILLTGNALVLPTDRSTASLLDIWPGQQQKIFSVSWHPAQPWLPPHVTCLRPGDWMARLGSWKVEIHRRLVVAPESLSDFLAHVKA